MPETTTTESAAPAVTSGSKPFQPVPEHGEGVGDRPATSPLDELSGMFEPPKEKPALTEKPGKPAEKPQEPAELAPETEEKTPEKPAEKPVKPTKPVQKSSVEGLREAYETSKRRVKELESELTSIKETHAKADVGELQTQLEAANKRAEAAETELKYTRYEKSDEYKKKYVEPLTRAFHKAYGDVVQLTLTDGDGNERPATKEDFDGILRMPLGQAKMEAKKFGEFAEEVMAHRRKILELHEEAGRAIEEYRTQGSEREKSMSAQQAATQQRAAKLFGQLNEQARKKNPDWFTPVEGDEEGNKLLQWGYGLADKLFGDQSKLSEGERVALHSAAYNQLAGFGRMALRVKKLTEQVKELETKLEQYEESEPSGGGRKPKPAGAPAGGRDNEGRPVSPFMVEAASELDEIAAGKR